MSRGKSKFSLRGAIEEALRHAKMETCGFGETVFKPEFPLPKKESEVDAFIKGRTRLWRQSWLIPALENALAKIKSRDTKTRFCKECESPLDKSRRPLCTNSKCFYAKFPQYHTKV